MYHLPNPPEIFEGRTDERAWLCGRLAQSPLSILWGPLGLGKTGLALRVVADLRIPRAAYHSALDTPEDTTFLISFGRCLAGLAGETVEWLAQGRSRADLIMLNIELAERAGAVVLVDDLHAVDHDLTERLLLSISRYARKSRFVVMTRTRPRHEELADKALRIEPLPEEDLARLVRRCAPLRGAPEAAALAREAMGSPFRARRLVLSQGADPGGSLLVDLGDEAKRAVQALRVLRFAAALPAHVARELDERGLIRLTASGVRLDDRLRSLLDAEPLDAAEARRTALSLVLHTEGPASAFEAVRLAIEEGDAALCASLLDERLFMLCAAGYAEGLFELLGRLESPALLGHRLGCADWIHGGASLAWAAALPEPADPRVRLLWCRLLVHGGAVARARDTARALAEHGPVDLQTDAALLLADILRHTAEVDASVALLERLEVRSTSQRIDRDLRLATALMLRGDFARATDMLASMPEKLEGLRVEERRRLRATLASALLASSRFRELERVLGAGEPPADCRPTELFAHLALAVERGRFDLGRRLLDRVEPFVDESVYLRFVHRYNTLRLRLFAGPGEGLEELARELAFDAPQFKLPELVVWSFCAKAAIDVTCAPPVTLADLPAGMAVPEGTARVLLEAWQVIVAARRGAATASFTTPPDLPTDVGLVARRAEAEAAIARDELDHADGILEGALDLARREGFAIEEANLLALLLDVRLLRAARGTSARTLVELIARSLAQAAERLGSARLAAEARLATWLVSDRRDPAVLLSMAEDPASPVVRRRARGLLGREDTQDALDRRIVARSAHAAARSEDSVVVVLDLEQRALLLPSGKRVDLSSADLHVRILEVLVRGGGRATKEDLVLGAWGLPSYHPHRDDKRLQVAVHRMRQVLEEKPKEPALLLRDGDGYRLGVPVRLGRLGASAM
ncbi:winged helix-turn-helix domain-containing protein [Polyangium jinanense]|uniref:Winged helix-turn-helix domain-containing protein n=2 Tax=Polyangium jinanense TaxID=2829994 RepID=A0A9X3XH18_9BACT|nr:winged helix-turn-helix domain-containing protein [Polyangium jinanense]